MRSRTFLTLFAIFAVVLFLHGPSARAEISVSAALSDQDVEAGESATLQITVSGSQGAEQPQMPDVPHLQFDYAGQQNSFQMYNFKVTSSLVFNYSVTADQAGNFTIPAITVQVEGKNYSTKPVTFHVGGSAAQSGGNSSQKAYFAQIDLPKKAAYVGEAIPVEVKVFVDTRIHWQAQQLPELTADGVTAPKLTVANQGQTDLDGRTYDVVIFKTAVTPVKSGDIAIGPCPFDCLMQIPQGRRRQQLNSPFQNFFGDDFPDPFNTVTRQVTITAPAAKLQVKPLPEAGKPADFAGAVGMFKISGQSSVSEVKAGEPLTLTVSVSGHGNFDRVNAPQLVPTPGWRSYPATAKMKTDDDLGLNGTKTFQIALVPSGGQQELPPLHFSYFDPEAEKYVTLATERSPLRVDGNLPIAAPSPVIAQSTAAPTPASDKDILFILPTADWKSAAFTPVYQTTGFWVAQAVPLTALLGFGLIQRSRRKAGDERAKRARQLARQSDEQKAIWQKSGVPRAQFYAAATAWMRTISAAKFGGEPDALGGAEILSRTTLHETTRDELKSIFEAHSELLYSGGTRSNEPLPEARREALVNALNAFQKQP